MDLEKRLQEYLQDVCENIGIYLDLRFASLADINKFYTTDGKSFFVMCDDYHVSNIEELKFLLLNTYIVRLSQHTRNDEGIALFVKDITNTGNGYNVSVGGQLFKQDI